MPAVKLGDLFVIRLALAAVVLLVGGRAAFGDRPRAPRLLPETTVAYLCIDDAQELVEQFGSTALGRVYRDPQVQPFVEHLYASVTEAFSGIADELGMSLSELSAIPQGEICLALVPGEEGPPALLALVEVRQQLAKARRLVAHVQAKMEERGDLMTNETWQDTELTVLQPTAEPNRQVVFFEKDETIAVTTDLGLAKQLLSAWRGTEASTLGERPEFTAIMERCSGTDDDRPQLTYFVDPIKLFKSISSGNMGLQVGLSILRPLGLDGLQGFGGSLILGGDRFESVHQMHVLLESPKTGVLEMLALRPGDVTPEVWVPHDAATYMTVHWDFHKSYSALVEVYDFFRDEGGWANDVEGPFSDRFGVDLGRDVLAALEGRITRVTWVDESTRRRATLFGLKLKDIATFRKTLDKVADSEPNLFSKRTVAGVSGYEFSARRGPDDAGQVTGRLPESVVAILGDYLLLTDREKLLERAVATKNGESRPLAGELDFKLIASMIRRHAGGKKPSIIWFERPEVMFRATYELLRSDETRQRLGEMADGSQLFGALHEAMNDSPLPPFSELKKYFAFSGGLATSDKTGIHSVGFTYRRK